MRAARRSSSRRSVAVAFSRDGKILASGAGNTFDNARAGEIILWEVDTGREQRRLQGHRDQVWTAVFSPSGQGALSASADRTVRLWDLRAGREVCCYDTYTDQVWSVAFSPDGRYAMSDGDAWTVRLWEPKKQRQQMALQGHGIVRVPRYAVRAELANKSLETMFEQASLSPERVSAYYSKAKHLPAKTIDFVNFLESSIGVRTKSRGAARVPSR